MGKAAIRVGRMLVHLSGFTTLLLSTFWLPWQAGEIVRSHPLLAEVHTPILICIYLTLIPFGFALYEADRILRRAEHGKSPEPWPRKSLMRIAGAFFTIGLLYLAAWTVLLESGRLVPGWIALRLAQSMGLAFLISGILGALWKRRPDRLQVEFPVEMRKEA